MADRFFPFFFGLAEKGSGLVYSLYSSWHPHRGGGVNERNVTYYCFIVKRTILLVVYKRVSLKVNDCQSGCEVCCCDGGCKMGFRPFSDKQVDLLGGLVE